jgi:hypothetical protein
MRWRDFILGVGGAVAWSLAARERTVPVIGFLDFFGPSPKSPSVEAFRAGLADGGLIDGANLSIE